jgi:hypothetical protein
VGLGAEANCAWCASGKYQSGSGVQETFWLPSCCVEYNPWTVGRHGGFQLSLAEFERLNPSSRVNTKTFSKRSNNWNRVASMNGCHSSSKIDIDQYRPEAFYLHLDQLRPYNSCRSCDVHVCFFEHVNLASSHLLMHVRTTPTWGRSDQRGRLHMVCCWQVSDWGGSGC